MIFFSYDDTNLEMPEIQSGHMFQSKANEVPAFPNILQDRLKESKVGVADGEIGMSEILRWERM